MMPMFEADGGAGSGGQSAGDSTPQSNAAAPQSAPPAIDYEKLAQLVSGKQAITEDSVLKGYFKQQGLSQEEMNQAITAFKQQKAASQPDVNAIQTQLAEAQATARQVQLQNAATMAAVSLGIDAKTIPYVIKMADLSGAADQEGKVNEEEVKKSLNKVLEDVPGLKPQPGQTTGFIQVGAASSGQTGTNVDAELDRIFKVKKEG